MGERARDGGARGRGARAETGDARRAVVRAHVRGVVTSTGEARRGRARRARERERERCDMMAVAFVDPQGPSWYVRTLIAKRTNVRSVALMSFIVNRSHSF